MLYQQVLNGKTSDFIQRQSEKTTESRYKTWKGLQEW